MDFNQFINQHIVNKNNEIGVVKTIDDRYVVIQYSNDEKTYQLEMVFKKGFITFVKGDLNTIINEYVYDKNKEKENQERYLEECRHKASSKYKRIREMFKRLDEKNQMMKYLFGQDFIYPPYYSFLKKYRRILP